MKKEIESSSTNSIPHHRYRKTADFDTYKSPKHNSGSNPGLFQGIIKQKMVGQSLITQYSGKRLALTSFIEPALSEDELSDKAESWKHMPYNEYSRLIEENEIVTI